MIVIGVDVHKHALTAVAIDELGRQLASWSGPVEAALLSWARSLAAERLWALEDCRHVSRGLERKQNEGKSRREAIRCLKRQLAPSTPPSEPSRH